MDEGREEEREEREEEEGGGSETRVRGKGPFEYLSISTFNEG